MIYTSRTFPFEYGLEEADVSLVGIPWDSSETGKSVKHGPLFIREALKGLPGIDPETRKNPFEQLKFCDMGDVEVVPANWGLTRERITDTLSHMLKLNPRVFPIFLGGDHLITLGILESLGKMTVVHLDAHADMNSNWLGESYSHITWGYHAVKKGFNIVQIGIRSSTKDEDSFIEQNRDRFKTLEQAEGPVYLTIDMDVFDPGFAPEVGTPEPLGMEPKEAFSILKEICAKNLVGMDIVECASAKVNTPTALLAAQLVKKALCFRKDI